jgi:L-ascorbate metabolism protein UlaG (beta-lactamase superfamily)
MQIMMIGHSTLLIETDGQRVVTDPYFGTWGNPAFRRLTPPARTREELRDVNLVLLSHNHWDHVDRRFFGSLSRTIPVVTSNQTTWLTKGQGAQNVIGLNVWESREFGNLKITAVPARHTAIATGFVLQSENKQVYFAGDTYYGPFMKTIGNRFQLLVALMPVTTYRLPMTMGEQGAVYAVQDLSPKVVIPIHLGIRPRFPLLRTNNTPEGFERRLREAKLETKVVILKDGETWSL